MSSSERKFFRLKSFDNKILEVDECITAMSKPIKDLVDEIGVDQVVPLELDSRDSKGLAMAIQWVEKHAEGKTAQEQLFKEWEAKIGPADDEDNHMKIQRVLADLWITAYSLKMQQLRDQTMQRKAELLASSILRTDSQRVFTNQDTD